MSRRQSDQAHPLREGLIARLMTALARAGRQAEAIDWYHRTRRRLADEPGIVPGPELTAVFQAVLRADHGRSDSPQRLTNGRRPATRTR
jgi:DNA-binding SARP family transcriptional activator